MSRQMFITSYYRISCYVCGETKKECKRILGRNCCSLKCELKLKEENMERYFNNMSISTNTQNLQDIGNDNNKDKMDISNEEIGDRLGRYSKFMSDASNMEVEQNTKVVDIMKFTRYLNMIEKKVKYGEIELFVCASQPVCHCQGGCMCDDDNYYPITELRVDVASNNIIYLVFKTPIKTNQKNSLKFFTLGSNFTEETIFFLKRDVRKKKTSVSKGNRPVPSPSGGASLRGRKNRTLEKKVIFKESLYCKQFDLNFDLFEGTSSQETFLEIKFDVMNYY